MKKESAAETKGLWTLDSLSNTLSLSRDLVSQSITNKGRTDP